MSFWETFWAVTGWFLWATIFIAYLLALFSVLVDIIRDSSLRGWAKAVWILFLVFVPFITALIYLVVRGDGMGERTARTAQTEQRAAEDCIRSVAGAPNPASQIERAAKVRDAGTISQPEFERLKARALAG